MHPFANQSQPLIEKARKLYEETDRYRVFRIKWDELDNDGKYHWCVFARSASKPDNRDRRP